MANSVALIGRYRDFGRPDNARRIHSRWIRRAASVTLAGRRRSRIQIALRTNSADLSALPGLTRQ